MTSQSITPADQIAGLLSATQAQAQRIVELEIHIAALRRLLAEAKPTPDEKG